MKRYSLKAIFFILTVGFSFFLSTVILAQTNKDIAIIEGQVLDSLKKPVSNASVGILEEGKAVQTDEEGKFRLESSPKFSKEFLGKEVTLAAQHPEFRTFRQKIVLKSYQNYTIRLSESELLKAVEVTAQINNDDRETSKIVLDTEGLEATPTGTGEFSQILVTLGLGITSSSELSSAYSVRGGNYEENLIYVNGIEIYRPFLVRSGQQEGLSFVNLDLVKKVEFSAGGWQAKWGDKLSSVLNVDYKNPTKFAGSASVGLLGGNAHVEGTNKSKRFSYLAGVRHKDLSYLLNTLETKGEYQPRFSDFQSLLSYKLGKLDKDGNFKNQDKNTTLSLLVAYSQNRYRVFPSGRETTFGTFDEQVRFFVDYTGEELMNYTTYQTALRLTQKFSQNFSMDFTVSGVDTREREFVDTEGAYRLCDVNNDITSDNFNKCTLVRGAASEYFYARNSLDAQIYSFKNRSSLRLGDRTMVEFGGEIKNEIINDELFEYKVLDSAGFADINYFVETETQLNSIRTQGYAQISHFFGTDTAEWHNVTFGVRVHNWSLNGQTFISPRLQYKYQPDWKADIQFGLAAGIYQQSPFYRELRNFAGEVNESLLAQRSLHIIGSMDWDFKFSKRPFKLIVESYYKQIANLIPYDVDNMRLRYYATNAARGYAWGIDSRISGEFIKGTESWFSLSYLQTKENTDFDERDFIRRPTDQRVTATIFFEDHFPNNPTFRVNLRVLFGSGVPFGAPNNQNYRSFFNNPSYRRVDIGFSKSLVFDEDRRIKSVWLGLEVLNILGVENIISHQWISDYVNDVQLAVPNGLSQRFLNVRGIVKF
ncbi:TonB-dependent receptor plug domain-containing protein [Bernardetia sp.]|uniref:TonB-dependent receptor n=1 Tax=Bernardetia sp. TaxID=1937974 RepID=UPI0025BE1693|nr:TonB-dependent receptor plug domain-containing protein [Bernardetia sp.]